MDCHSHLFESRVNFVYYKSINMAQAMENHQKTPQGGGRGLLMVWRKELEKSSLLIDTCLGRVRGPL